MAEVIDSVDGGFSWDKFFDGRSWELRRGVDYEVDSGDFARKIRRTARSRGLVARTNTNRERVRFKVHRPMAE